MNNKITIGTRGSKLSLAYAGKVKDLILQFDPINSDKIVIETIKTSGDLFQNKNISEIGEKIYFARRSRIN